MRIIAILLLAGLVVLASLPQAGTAGTGAHDCASCPEAMAMAVPHHPQVSHAPGQDEPAPCTRMALCAAFGILSGEIDTHPLGTVRLHHGRPAAIAGTPVILSLNLPPPRSRS